MRVQIITPVLALITILPQCLTLSLPSPLGPYCVSQTTLSLTDASRSDPLAPSPRERKLMLSIFYPSAQSTPSPAYTSLFAGYLDTHFSLPSGTAGAVVSQTSVDAPLKKDSWNGRTLFFSPGYSLSRVEFTASLSNLASHGYIVIGTDHPFDTAFLDYPDGEVVRNTQAGSVNWTSPDYVGLRSADVRFLREAFTSDDDVARNIPGLHHALDPAKTAVFGHSFGGATAAWAVHDEPEFLCGANLDGILWGPVVNEGVDRPFLIMGEEFRNRSVEPSWATFRTASTAFKQEVSVEDVLHMGYTDELYLLQKWQEEGLVDGSFEQYYGTIDGYRMFELLDAYLVDYFKGCFGGNSFGLVEGPSEEWPEVRFYPDEEVA